MRILDKLLDTAKLLNNIRKRRRVKNVIVVLLLSSWLSLWFCIYKLENKMAEKTSNKLLWKKNNDILLLGFLCRSYTGPNSYAALNTGSSHQDSSKIPTTGDCMPSIKINERRKSTYTLPYSIDCACTG